MATHQCDQIGRFLKVLGYKFSNQSGANILQLSKLLWKALFYKWKLRWLLFWHCTIFLKKHGPISASFSIYFRLFNMLQFKLKLNKSVDGVFGIRTRGGLMEGANESTELWRHPYHFPCYDISFKYQFCLSKLRCRFVDLHHKVAGLNAALCCREYHKVAQFNTK